MLSVNTRKLTMKNKEKVLVGISGGVDSSVALKLLKDTGYEVEAAYLIMNDVSENCKKAENCAKQQNVPCHIIDCRSDFENAVISDFISEYKRGRTPNPCVVCNRSVKFKALYRFAKENGFDKIATGHYAKLIYDEKTQKHYIKRSDDAKKDQSYMLWQLSQEILSMLILPLEKLHKEDVRKIAAENGLISANDKDSLDICFIPDGNIENFMKSKNVPDISGSFVHKDGRFLGSCDNIIKYTVGQRRGLGLAMDRSVFVTDIDVCKAAVTVDYEEGLFSDTFTISDVSDDYSGDRLYVKIRYAAPPVLCEITKAGNKYTVHTEEKIRAVTPGQSAVFYDKDGVLRLGGYIDK